MVNISIENTITMSKEFFGGIGVITIDGVSNCGGRLKNLEKGDSGDGVTVTFDVFVQELPRTDRMEKSKDYPMKFLGPCEIYMVNGNLIIREGRTKTDLVLFPPATALLEELNLWLSERSKKS